MNIDSRRTRRLCIVPRVSGVGGMVSFSKKLESGLAQRGFEVSHDLSDLPYQAVLVVGGTRDLVGLWQARRREIPIIQRLDGINWLHRLAGFGRTGWRHFLRAEYGNLLLSLIRRRFASRVVYQSFFSRDWWERVNGKTGVEHTVIYNGVDLDLFCPEGNETPPEDRLRVLMVEGSLMGGYEQGLQVAVRLIEEIAARTSMRQPGLLELMIVGRISEELRNQWDRQLNLSGSSSHLRLNWRGLQPQNLIPAIDRSAHLLYSSDIHPACPNSVIEALACGLPVLSFDTGALPEIVTGDSGRIVPYGGDAWRLETPDIAGLAQAALELVENPARFRAAARQRAEAAFGLDQMVEAYLEFILTG